MKNTSTKFLLSAILVIVFSTLSFCKAIAQTPAGNVAVSATEKKTNIWVSNFPKNTTVVISDAENNMLSIVSTNDFGATFISLDKAIKTAITVKTFNGDIVASNKAAVKAEQGEVASIKTPAGLKA